MHTSPTPEQLATIFQATLHIPDHGCLQPYRFVVITEEKLPLFEAQLKQAGEEQHLGEKAQQKAEKLCQYSPMLIAVIANLRTDIKNVPQWEQLASACCATYALQLASLTQGFYAKWLSGQWLESNTLRQCLKCGEKEKIIALLPIKKTEPHTPKPRKKNVQDIVQYF